MTEFADTSLDFCKICLGWDDADTFTIGRGHLVVRNLSATEGAGKVFNVSDLNAVMEAVRGWCNDHRHQRYYLEINTTTMWNVHVCFGGATVGFGSSSLLAHALLTACVEAARKLNRTA